MPEDLFIRTQGRKYFMTLDLVLKAISRIELHPESQPLTTTLMPPQTAQYLPLPADLTDSDMVCQCLVRETLDERRRPTSHDSIRRAGRALCTYVALTMDCVSVALRLYRRRRRADRVLYIEVEVIKWDVKKWAESASLEPLQPIGALGTSGNSK